MRYAIFSDVHSNIQAFSSALKSISESGVDKKIFLGDIIGYGSNPNECIDLLQKVDIVLAGNHDYGVIGKTNLDRFNPYAREAALWTIKNLSLESKKYLERLPIKGRVDNITICHSSPKEPELWHYMTKASVAAENFNFFDTQLCFVGHSHRPLIIEKDSRGNVQALSATEVEIKDNYRYIINDGSVGQPRDGNNKGSYCLFDSDKSKIEIIRFSYDIEGQQNNMQQVGLPNHLIDRLANGL